MLTRNFDNIRTYTIYKEAGSNKMQDATSLKLINIIQGNPFVWTSYEDQPFFNWNNNIYGTSDDIPNVDTTMIWVGGERNGGNFYLSKPGISPIKEQYNDYNLYCPFAGATTDSDSDEKIEVLPQNTVIGQAYYDKEDKKWKRQVTREFKNISKRITEGDDGAQVITRDTIIVKEIGIFYRNCLIAREILDTPIEVPGEAYFKVGYTLICEESNPNEEIVRTRLYDRVYYDYRWTSGETITYNSSSNDRQIIIFKKNPSSIKGLDNISEENFIFKKDKDTISTDNIISFYLNHGNGLVRLTLSPEISKINYLTTKKIQNNKEITVSKEEGEKNIIWFVASLGDDYSDPSIRITEKGNDICDYLPAIWNNSQGNLFGTFFIDCTDSLSHTFAFSKEQSEIVVHKFQIEIDLSSGYTSLYQDTPKVQVTGE